MAKIMFGESVMNSLLGSTQATPEIQAEYDEYSHSSKYTDGILLCESHDITMLRLAKVADEVQTELEGKVSEMQMFAEGTFGDKGFFKGIWDFIVKCFTAVVDWVKSIFGKFVKVTEKTVKELEKVSNELKIKSEKTPVAKLGFTQSAKIEFFKMGAKDSAPALNEFIAHHTLALGIDSLWDTTSIKGFNFGSVTAEVLFEKDIADTLRTAVQASATAATEDEKFKGASGHVKDAVEFIRNNQNTTGGFGSENKEKKLKYFLNGMLDNDKTFKEVKAFRLTVGDSGDQSKTSAKEEFVKTFFEYQEHTYNGAEECRTFMVGICNINAKVNANTIKEMSKIKNKLSEGSKYFENIKKEYEKISSGFTAAAKSMSNSTGTTNEGARNNANSMSGFLSEVSNLTSWYTSNVINTYAIADLCVGKSASNLIGAFNLALNTLNNVETVS